jgi:hypothetical protein
MSLIDENGGSRGETEDRSSRPIGPLSRFPWTMNEIASILRGTGFRDDGKFSNAH